MYRRYAYRGRVGKYSNETVCTNIGVTDTKDGGAPLTDNPITIVPATTVLGNRKVKNFTLKFTAHLTDDPVIGVLAYVPEGTTMNRPTVTGPIQSLYEPNQNVIATFIIPPTCIRGQNATVSSSESPQTVTVSTRLARNLNTGDSIQLCLVSPNGIVAGDGTADNPPAVICGTVNYSIKY